MKKYCSLLTAGLCLVSVACSQYEADRCHEETSDNVLHVTSVTATSNAEEGVSTKTVRNSDLSVSWLPADEINLFYGGSSSKFTSTNTTKASRTNFSGYLSAVIGGGEGSGGVSYFYALYPYDPEATLSNEMITTTVKTVQEAVPDSFGDDTFVTVARSENTNLAFYNLCGGIKFSVKHAGVQSVTIKGRNNENIAGKVQIKVASNNIPSVNAFIDGSKEVTLVAPDGGTFVPGTYYCAVLLPTTFENGLEMTFNCATEKGVYTRKSTTTINRSQFGTLTQVDKNVVYESTLPPEPVVYSISRTLQNCALLSDVFNVGEDNDGFHASLQFSAGYDHFDFVEITMGGVAHNEFLVENNGAYSISIPEVTGDVFITLVAGMPESHTDYIFGGSFGD